MFLEIEIDLSVPLMIDSLVAAVIGQSSGSGLKIPHGTTPNRTVLFRAQAESPIG